MALIILTIIFFAGGSLAILYSVLALLSMLKYSRAQKALPEKYDSESGKPDTVGPPVADAFCRRARILLRSQRFDAALADCKRAIDINANHAEAHTLWEHALEKEIPPGLIEEISPETVAPPVEEVVAKKKIRKVKKRIKRRKKVEAKPTLEEKPEEAPPPVEEEFKKEPPEEEIAEAAVEPIPAPEEAEVEPVAVPVAKPEVVEEIEAEIEPVAVPVAEPEVEEEVEAEIEPVAVPAAEPEVEKEVEAEIEPEVEVEPTIANANSPRRSITALAISPRN